MKVWKHTFEAQDGKTYEAHGNEAMLHGCVRVVRSE